MIKDVDGVGKNEIRTLLEKVPTNSFRTVINSDGNTTTMLRTKGGMPEVTRTKPKPAPISALECVSSPLTEIAFAQSVEVDSEAGTGPVGFRSWYGSIATPRYHKTHDGLLSIPTRFVQKISFKDAKQKPVDFLFADKPEDPDATLDELPLTDADNSAASTARIKFTEDKYLTREWYGPEAMSLWWETVLGGKLGFFVRRLKSMMFRVSDTKNALRIQSDVVSPKKIKWVFTAPGVPDRSVRPNTSATGCADQNAREESFLNRDFFTPDTAGGCMKSLTMRCGLIDDPLAQKPNVRLDFKTPGSFIAAVDPLMAVGKTRPADVADAIDFCEIAASGPQYHGLMWTESAVQTFYRDSTKTSTWPVTAHSGSIFGGDGSASTRYYNLGGADPLDEKNIVRTANPDDGAMYRDVMFRGGDYCGLQNTFSSPTSLLEEEFLYVDSNKNVWVLSTRTESKFLASILLKRRYGVWGTNFGWDAPAQINRVLCTFSTLDFVLNAEISTNPNANEVMVKLFNAFKRMIQATLVVVSGSGAIAAADGVAVGDGITATANERFRSTQWVSGEPDFQEYSNVVRSTSARLDFQTQATGFANLECAYPTGGTRSYIATTTETVSPSPSNAWSNTTTTITSVTVLDYVWVDKWVMVKSVRKNTIDYDSEDTPVTNGYRTYVVACLPDGTYSRVLDPVTSTAYFTARRITKDKLDYTIMYDSEVKASVSTSRITDRVTHIYDVPGVVTENANTEDITFTSTPAGIPNLAGSILIKYMTVQPMRRSAGGWLPAQPKGYAIHCANRAATSDTVVVEATHQAAGNGWLVAGNTVVPVSHDDLCEYLYLGNAITAKVGFAHSQRTGEIVVVPVTASAFFV